MADLWQSQGTQRPACRGCPLFAGHPACEVARRARTEQGYMALLREAPELSDWAIRRCLEYRDACRACIPEPAGDSDGLAESLLSNLSEAVVVSDAAGRVRVWNRRFQELWSLEPETLRGLPTALLFQRISTLLQGPGTSWQDLLYLGHGGASGNDAPRRLTLLDGRRLVGYSQGIREPDGNPRGRLWLFREARDSGLATSRADLPFRLLAETASQGILVLPLNGHGRLLYANEAAASLLAAPSASHLMDGRRPLPDTLVAMARSSPTAGARSSDTTGATLTLLVGRRRGGRGWVEAIPSEVDWQGERALRITLTDVTGHKSLEQELRTLAATDSLTGLLNRRAFVRAAEERLLSQRGSDRPLTLLIADIDRFKAINDRHGHPAGDRVLEAVARLLRRHVRRDDVIGRLGGEEFAAVMPGVDTVQARRAAERMRCALAAEPVDAGCGGLHITMSIGVTDQRPGETELSQLLARADQALYRAKRAGRNQVATHFGEAG